MSLKLDMSKAYDWVEWGYLKCTLEVFGFPPKLVYLIMVCVESATFSIFINDVPTNHIIPSRGYARGTLYLRTFSCYVWKDL